MNARAFLDTNIFVYTFDARQPAKQEQARELVGQALANQQDIISFQVVQEFMNVATRKFAQPLSHADCQVYLEQVLTPLCEVFASIDLYRLALDTAQRWHYAFYDSLIIAAATQAGCRTLYSEDLQHGQRIENLTIINPFVLLEPNR